MLHEGLASGVVVASKYVVERPLGHGGMGAVYVVSHAQTGKRMAMKTLLPEFVQNADIVSRFLREAGVTRKRPVADRPAIATPASPEPAPPAAQPLGTTRRTAEGRAGKLGSDEF